MRQTFWAILELIEVRKMMMRKLVGLCPFWVQIPALAQYFLHKSFRFFFESI